MRSELGTRPRRQAYDGSAKGITGMWNATSPITAHPEQGGAGSSHQGGEYIRELDSILKHACLYMRGTCSKKGDAIAGAEYGTGEVEDTQLGATRS